MTEAVHIPLARVLDAAGGTVAQPGPGDLRGFGGVAIDSRAIGPGALFFALPGERVDGHDFVGAAVTAGARGVVVERRRGADAVATLRSLGAAEALVLEVDDPAQALGAIARAHRLAFPSLRVLAITGSNGKTTTKEMAAAILGAQLGAAAVLKTEGNLNNHLGVPLTLLRLHAGHRAAVIEMGMSGLGEIAYLAELARPDVAAIVSIAGVHLEQLGSIENVARAKAEIYGALGAGGVAVHPTGEAERLLAPYLQAMAPAQRRSFGPAADGDAAPAPAVAYDGVTASSSGLGFRLRWPGHEVAARVPLVGRHNASNAAAATAATLALGAGVDQRAVVDGLAQVQPAKHRAQLVPIGGRVILDDCYNAAPASMRAALDALVEVTAPGRRRLAVLGDMRELGSDAARLHAEIGAYAAARVDGLVTLGSLGRHIHDAAAATLGAARTLHTEEPRAAAEWARAMSGAGDVILVKASRGMRLERVIDAFGEER